MANLHVYADDGDRDGGKLGYDFGGKLNNVEWIATEVGKIQFSQESGMPLAERAALVEYIEKKLR
jgi:hypothetical protein